MRILKEINFSLSNSGKITPKNIKITNKYANDIVKLNIINTEELENFELKYIVFNTPANTSFMLPINDNVFYISSNITKVSGDYTVLFYYKENDTENASIYVSDEITFQIVNNFLQEDTGDIPEDENLKIWFEGIEEYVHSDEFKEDCKGEDGAPGPAGEDGKPGTTFIPTVSNEGVISWTNDGELPNPEPVNIKGPKGDDGNDIYQSYVDYSYWCGKMNQPEAIETKPFYFKDSSVYNLVNTIPEGTFYQVAYGDKTKWLYYKWTDGGDTTACLFKYWKEDEIDSSNFWSKQLLRVELWKNGDYKLNYHTDYTNMNDDTFIISNNGRVFLKHYILSPEDFADEYLRETSSNNAKKGGCDEGQECGIK